MDEYLERRIRAVFPTGVDWEPDKSQFDADGQRERLWKVIRLLQTAVTVERGWTHGYLTEFNMTLPEHPSFHEWQNMDRESRIAWLAQRGGKYPVLWLKVSRAADYFHFFFNTWVHKDSGIIDTTGEYGPTGRFVKFPELLIAAMEDMGFRQATPEMWMERVPFVLTDGYDDIPHDDPRWEDDDFEPEPVPASVYDCIFGDY